MPSTNEITAAGAAPLSLLTVTWRGDFSAFQLLRASLQHSNLREVPHHTVVHSEDLNLFQGAPHRPGELHSTATVLPADLDEKRQDALRKQQRWGRHWVRRLTSLRRFGGPRWVRYIGWQMQQLSKLAWVAAQPSGTVVVLDSDVVVTPRAQPGRWQRPDGAMCYSQPCDPGALTGKVRKWNRTAQRLFPSPEFQPDRYFDTPFVFDVARVRAMLADLESRFAMPWYEALLQQPPRRWSEFATYRAYLQATDTDVHWQAPDRHRYQYDASSLDKVQAAMLDAWIDPACDCLTIHSQSSGRQMWDIAPYVPALQEWIAAHAAVTAVD